MNINEFLAGDLSIKYHVIVVIHIKFSNYIYDKYKIIFFAFCRFCGCIFVDSYFIDVYAYVMTDLLHTRWYKQNKKKKNKPQKRQK